jgi:hypothetical protein
MKRGYFIKITAVWKEANALPKVGEKDKTQTFSLYNFLHSPTSFTMTFSCKFMTTLFQI